MTNDDVIPKTESATEQIAERKIMPFPDMFIVSLKDSKRRQHCAERMKKHDVKWEWFDGINGRELSEKDKCRLVNDEFWRANRGRRLSPGEIGCALSHLYLWQKIIDKGIPFAVILEDDAVLKDDFFAVVRDAVENKTDWDMIILHPKKRYAVDTVICNIGKEGRQLVRYKRRVGQTLAYIITAEAAEKLVNYCAEIRAPIDWLTGEWWRNELRYYGVIPQVAYVAEVPSEIQVLSRCPRTLREHFSAFCYRMSDWMLRRRMLRTIKPKQQ